MCIRDRFFIGPDAKDLEVDYKIIRYGDEIKRALATLASREGILYLALFDTFISEARVAMQVIYTLHLYSTIISHPPHVRLSSANVLR